jgi:hypothetical protein
MRAAGEPSGLVAGRLAHGDEFFGWLAGDRIVSFGWVMYRDRTVGPARLAEAPGRAFIFNCHTSERERGRGLFPALLRATLCVLGPEGTTELLADVNVQNTSSTRGMEKAGYLPAAEIACLMAFNRWPLRVRQTMLDTGSPSLF